MMVSSLAARLLSDKNYLPGASCPDQAPYAE
jgi:hypothetical protein